MNTRYGYPLYTFQAAHLTAELHAVSKNSYVHNYIKKLSRKQAQVTLNHENKAGNECNTDERSRNHSFPKTATNIAYSKCVCSLSYSACYAHAPYSHLWPVRLYSIFAHYLINGTIFVKNLFNIKCVF